MYVPFRALFGIRIPDLLIAGNDTLQMLEHQRAVMARQRMEEMFEQGIVSSVSERSARGATVEHARGSLTRASSSSSSSSLSDDDDDPR